MDYKQILGPASWDNSSSTSSFLTCGGDPEWRRTNNSKVLISPVFFLANDKHVPLAVLFLVIDKQVPFTR
jgi:hypothetical protein